MSNDRKTPLDIASLRAKLGATKGQQYWRSLDELADTPEFHEMLHREFPRQASEWLGTLDRRSFLKLMAASFALAGLSSCGRQPDERIVPYVRAPENLVPGKPLMFATASLLGGYALGTLVRSDMGRPTKIEGNPQHPGSLGSTDVFTQASILGLYDPDRAQIITRRGAVQPWENLLEELKPAIAVQEALRGAGLRVLTGAVTSPTLAAQIQKLLERFPEARWHRHEPAGRESVLEGARMAFGRPMDTQYRLADADVILALDADFLCYGPAGVRYAREFAARRKPEHQRGMNRLYAVESLFTNTGGTADHRFPVPASRVEQFARAVAEQLGISGLAPAGLSGQEQNWASTVARDLRAHHGASVVIPGESQPPVVHALAHAINVALGAEGATVVHTDPVETLPAGGGSTLAELAGDMQSGKVDLLLILDANPVYDAPADLNFQQAMSKVGLAMRLGQYDDETAFYCHWNIPAAHSLEAWSDARSYDGTITIMQPLIAPLFNGKSAHELLAEFTGQSGITGYDLVRDYWRTRTGGRDFEEFWRDALNNGLVRDSALPVRTASLTASPGSWPHTATDTGEYEVVFRPDPSVWDGRFANNGWLQELPRPFTKLTWDNAALVGPATAEKLGLQTSDVIEISYKGRQLRAPVFIQPGQADGSVSLHLGYGRTRTGKVASGAGFNAYAIRTSDAPWFGGGAVLRKTGETYPLSVTQEHHGMEDRAPVRTATLQDYKRDPAFAEKIMPAPAREETLYPEYQYDGYAWGMAIDLSACTGCNACMIACQAENNIPIVGKEQVGNSREMHWIRVDQYYSGDLENPQVHAQPVACVHCENAPCEVVCPVAATVHDHEGLNVMVYNRCVGTRYCSNNCPYKVRRFNFLQYTDNDAPTLAMQRNPDVSVRSRGVMEKCTYCVQRISAARIEAKKQDRPIRDGEVVTACQAACPSQAIVFGDINDKESAVRRLKADPRDYGLLAELNTRPRTTYLARITNPNPELEGKSHSS